MVGNGRPGEMLLRPEPLAPRGPARERNRKKERLAGVKMLGGLREVSSLWRPVLGGNDADRS